MKNICHVKIRAVHKICSKLWSAQNISAGVQFLPPFLVNTNDFRGPLLVHVLVSWNVLVEPKGPGEYKGHGSLCIGQSL